MSRTRHTAADEPHFMIRSVTGTFDQGAAIAEHSHSWHQLIYAVNGVITVRTDHGSWVAPPHWAVWAPANVGHSLQFTGRTSLHALYLRKGLVAGPRRSTVLAVSPLLRELIARAVSLGMLDRRNAAHRAISRLIAIELRQHPAAALDLPWPQTGRLRMVAEFIADHGGRDRHAALARRFAISSRTLERGFLKETGMSLGHWRRQMGFQRALQRLGAGGSVKEAAFESGYRSPSAFIAAFRRQLNITPARYFSSAGEA